MLYENKKQSINKTDKIQFITLLQTFATICVFLGHAVHVFSDWGWYTRHATVDYVCNTIHHIIYSFHMPLFIFLSGYLLGYKKDETFNYLKYIIKRFKRLIVPLYIVGICYYIPFLILVDPYGYLGYLPSDIIRQFFTFQLNGHLWFLITLFVITLMILPFTSKLFKKIPQIFILAGLFVLSFLKIKGIPYSIIMAFKLAVYFYLGYLFTLHKEDLQKIIAQKYSFITTTFIWLILEIINLNNWGNIYWATPTAIISIVFLFFLFYKLSIVKNNWSQNSLVIFISTNMFALYILHEPIMVSILKILNWGNILPPLFVVLILFISTILISSGLIIIWNKLTSTNLKTN